MTEMKICPQCAYDYYPHVEKCAKCGVVLVSFEEHARMQEDKKRLAEQALEDPVAVREGDVRWMEELLQALTAAGIPCRLHADAGCATGCRGNTCKLLVSRRDGPRAHERCEEYFSEVHPEARASQEMMSQGKCPACGSAVDPGLAECPDCGLTLFVIE
jgi:hypothetical protein